MYKRKRALPIESFLSDFDILINAYKFYVDKYYDNNYTEDDLYYLTSIDSCFCNVFDTIRKLKNNLER